MNKVKGPELVVSGISQHRIEVKCSSADVCCMEAPPLCLPLLNTYLYVHQTSDTETQQVTLLE